jgi:hypothetical protein
MQSRVYSIMPDTVHVRMYIPEVHAWYSTRLRRGQIYVLTSHLHCKRSQISTTFRRPFVANCSHCSSRIIKDMPDAGPLRPCATWEFGFGKENAEAGLRGLRLERIAVVGLRWAHTILADDRLFDSDSGWPSV